jgi:CheY-like chemotaxis protein
LKQVLINLLSNAIKYNTVGGTVVVECGGSSSPQRVRLNVRDSGAGLPPEMLAQLFQPFNRLGQEHGTEQGTGIGLVMSKRLVELMGGVLGAESRVGVGSVFWCELGAASASQREMTPPPEPVAHPPAPADATPRTLLYVEDNPANLKLVEQLIARRPGMRLVSAGDGNLGVQLARTHLPDVILMDINLPGISGIEALAILRGDPVTARIPVVALSANAMPSDVTKGLAAGFVAYLTKPIKVTEFMAALDAVIASGASHA